MTVSTILLTGASGLVGRNLQEHCKGSTCTLLTPSSSELNLLDYPGTSAYLKRVQPDLVIHAAGKVGGIQANIANPVEFLVNNTDMARNIMLASAKTGVKKLINLGSSCMYPRLGENPLKEESILHGELEPTNEGYAIAKIYAARLAKYLNQEYPDIRYKTLIPCNLYGRHDKFSPEHSHLLAAVIHKLHRAKIGGEETVTIWGDGTARREFMYASDFADALLRAVTHFDTLPDLMNIGVGHDHTINDYYQIAARVIGWQGQFIHETSRPVGMLQKLVSVDKLSAWGWSPATSLTAGIERTYEYYLEQHCHGV